MDHQTNNSRISRYDFPGWTDIRYLDDEGSGTITVWKDGMLGIVLDDIRENLIPSDVVDEMIEVRKEIQRD